MRQSSPFLNPSEAAKSLGVSTKALRLYEQRGLLTPVRSDAGWRTYGPEQMAQAAEIVALRALGLSLAQVARVQRGEPALLEPALAAHQATLEGRIRQLGDTVDKVRALREDLARDQRPETNELFRLLKPTAEISVAFDLPWPWGGERFTLRALPPLTYITGPLVCGKTRLAQCIAETLPDAAFLGLERLDDETAAEARTRLKSDPVLKARVDKTMDWLIEDGAAASSALIALMVALECETPAVLVIDMVETGLDQASQEALISHLRQRGADARRLFLMTRSCVILDLSAVGSEEAILFCPANHSPPSLVAAYPGAPGYEAVASCLASPEVRARTEGVIAWRPEVA